MSHYLEAHSKVEIQQPWELKEYFRERSQHNKNVALQFLRDDNPVYQRDADK